MMMFSLSFFGLIGFVLGIFGFSCSLLELVFGFA